MRIRQIVLAAHDLAAGRTILAKLLDLPAPYRDPGVAEFGIDNAVFCFGDQFIEVVSPTREGSACGRHLKRHGDSGYMLLLQTDDLARERARFQVLGLRSVWSAEYEDISAMHLHPKDVGAAIVSVDEPRPAASWRWGGPDWQVQPGAAGQQRVLGLTLGAEQPETLARRWAEVFGRPAPVPGVDGRWRVVLHDGGFVDVETARAQQADTVLGFTLAVANPSAVLAAAAALGLAASGSMIEALGARWTIQALPTS